MTETKKTQPALKFTLMPVVTKRSQPVDYDRFVATLKQVITQMKSQGMDAAFVPWDEIKELTGISVKVHTFFCDKQKKVFNNNKTIKHIERRLKVKLTADRNRNAVKVAIQ